MQEFWTWSDCPVIDLVHFEIAQVLRYLTGILCGIVGKLSRFTDPMDLVVRDVR